jgi:very-short-patch-repair endonuclease
MRRGEWRAARFLAGQSIVEIARTDRVTVKTVAANLRAAGVLPRDYLVDLLLDACRRRGLPAPEEEVEFLRLAPPERQDLFRSPKQRKIRQYRADLYYSFHRVAIEIDGGTHLHAGGRHGADRDKRNAYCLAGIRVLYFDADQLNDPEGCAALVEAALTPLDM